jgi:septum formation protein
MPKQEDIGGLMQKIILASASSRRRELLASLGLEFKVIPSRGEEVFDSNKTLEENIQSIALSKAKSVAAKVDEDCIVIGADTIVAVDGRILGKPKDMAEAGEMLRCLSDRAHFVYTGFALIRKSDNKVQAGYEKTLVDFRPLSKEMIDAYIQTGEPLDKAGAYGIQGIGAVFVKGIKGDYSNVVGLPLCRIATELEKFGINILGNTHRLI